MQFSLDPVVRMGRPADRKACLCIAMREEQILFVDVRSTPWLGEQDAKEFRDRQNTGHASEAPGG